MTLSKIDMLFALTQEVVDIVSTRLLSDGLLICDTTHHIPAHFTGKAMPLPFAKILSETENPKGASMIALGAVAKALGFTENQLQAMMNPNWPPAFQEKNVQTASLAYRHASAHFQLDCRRYKKSTRLIWKPCRCLRRTSRWRFILCCLSDGTLNKRHELISAVMKSNWKYWLSKLKMKSPPSMRSLALQPLVYGQ